MKALTMIISIIAYFLVTQTVVLADNRGHRIIFPNNTPFETVIVPFTGGPSAVTTVNTYSGNVWLCVSGVGQAAGQKPSDAFYVYTSGSGNILPPPGVIGTDEQHPWHSLLSYNWVLSIDNQHAENFIVPIIPRIGPNVPLYNPAHVYAFPINTSGGPLTFGVSDVGAGDNMGSYTITVGNNANAFGCYINDIIREINDGYGSGAITLNGNSLFANLDNVESSIRNGNYQAASNKLEALVNEIKAQSGKNIDQTLADELIGNINYLIGLINAVMIHHAA